MCSVCDEIGTRAEAYGSEGKEMQHGRAGGSREGDARSGTKDEVGREMEGSEARGEERVLVET